MKRLNSNGFSINELMIAIGIGAFVLTGAGALWIGIAKYQTSATSKIELEGFRQHMTFALTDDAAWKQTLLKNTNMACALSLNHCTTNGSPTGPPITNQRFDLYDRTGKLVLEGTSDSAGLTLQGKACNSYSPAGNDECPFHYQLSWTAICTSAQCSGPQIKVNAILKYSPSPTNQAKLEIDPLRYSISDYFINMPNCRPTVQIFSTPGDYDFIVPDQYSYMRVELWGGGGGGGAALATINGCDFDPGKPGGDSFFINSAATTATGGMGGTQMIQGGYHVHNWCTWTGVCGVFRFGSCDGAAPGPNGEPGQSLLPFQFTTFPITMRSCLPNLGEGQGAGGIGFSMNGVPGAGAGSGSGSSSASQFFILPYGIVQFAAATNGASGGLGGTAVRLEFTPATLAPKTIVKVHVGAKGLGGVLPSRLGGSGANGLVRVVYF